MGLRVWLKYAIFGQDPRKMSKVELERYLASLCIGAGVNCNVVTQDKNFIRVCIQKYLKETDDEILRSEWNDKGCNVDTVLDIILTVKI